MSKYLLFIAIVLLAGSCKSNKGPNVSDIKINLQTLRFDRDFFAMDTNNVAASLDQLDEQYPVFLKDYLHQILGIPPIKDSGAQIMQVTRQFIHDYRPVYDSVNKQFPDFSSYEKEITEGLKHVKYYFPDYPLPTQVITFIGPMDAYFQGSTSGYGDAITADALLVGLQLHMGEQFSMYHSEMGLALYPLYISRKFTPEYIAVNCIKNIIDDMYPDESGDKTLIEQMVEKGKRIYLLNKLMPSTPDTLKIGYTDKQLKGCLSNEGLIWNYFIRNGLVYNNDPSLIKNYIGESPGTPELGEGAPGNIGLFTGWRIVSKYMNENSSGSLDELMKTDAKLIFENSRYRPK